MKFIYSILCATILLFACDTKKENMAEENMADATFEKNAKVVRAMLEGFQNGNVDYSVYANDYVMKGTAFGDKDSLSLEEMKISDQRMLEMFDFKIMGDSLNFLPGVNADTKMADGSVRYYATWKVTRPATDSTQEKSGMIPTYHSWDFNEEGKIIYEQMYGDVGALMMHLTGPDKMEEMKEK